MKDLLEIRFDVHFETKVVVSSDELPEGSTEPLSKLAEAVLPAVERAIKEYLLGKEEARNEKQTSKE